MTNTLIITASEDIPEDVLRRYLAPDVTRTAAKEIAERYAERYSARLLASLEEGVAVGYAHAVAHLNGGGEQPAAAPRRRKAPSAPAAKAKTAAPAPAAPRAKATRKAAAGKRTLSKDAHEKMSFRKSLYWAQKRLSAGKIQDGDAETIARGIAEGHIDAPKGARGRAKPVAPAKPKVTAKSKGAKPKAKGPASTLRAKTPAKTLAKPKVVAKPQRKTGGKAKPRAVAAAAAHAVEVSPSPIPLRAAANGNASALAADAPL